MESIRLFQSVDSHVLDEIAQGIVLREVKAGEVIFGKDPSTGKYVNDLNLLVVVKGKVEIFTEIEQTVGGVTKEKVRELVTTVEEGKTVSSILGILESLINVEGPKGSLGVTPKQRKLHVQENWNKSFNEQEEEEGFLVDKDQIIRNKKDNTNGNDDEEDEELITAIASYNTILAEIPLYILHNIQEKYPRVINRLIQSIIMRLQRVTLLTMNKYFGLTRQLINPSIKRKSIKKLQNFNPRKYRYQTSTKENQLREDFDCAFNAFSKLLSLDDYGEEILRKNLLIERHSPGSIVMAPRDPYVRFTESDSKVNDACEACLYYIIRGGCLDVYLHDDTHLSTQEDNDTIELVNTEESLLFKGLPGDITGQLAILTGDFYYRVIASKITPDEKGPIVLGKLKRDAFNLITLKNHKVMNRVVHMVFLQLAPIVKLIDYAVDWNHLQAGDIVCHQGLPTTGMYVVLSGRLRAVHSETEKKKKKKKPKEKELFTTGDESLQGRAIAEYGRGDSFGALETLTDSPFTSSVVAVRDTELALISSRLFKIFMRKYPEVVVRFSQIIGASWQKQISHSYNMESKSGISTITVLGLNENCPVKSFCTKLASELNLINPTIHLDKNYTIQSLGKNSFDKRKEEILIRWLGEMEEVFKIVVYECDSTLSAWTKRCLRQADCILLLSDSDENYEISEVEKYLLQNSNISARKDLVLLHKDSIYPKNTMKWLNLRRGWCRGCHQIVNLQIEQKDDDSFHHHHHHHTGRNRNRSSFNTILTPIPRLIKRGADSIWKSMRLASRNDSKNTPLFGHANPKDDVARLARILTGTAIGLVLGGGGARGCSHVGVIQALEENGIPIDMVGGTSMGSLVGALYARDPDYIHVYTKAKVVAKKMSNRWSQALDLTYPRVSFFTGAGLNEVLYESMKKTRIEDLTLNYFAISTDITNSKMVVHREGLLWRYVRASMSLVGFVPPLCDDDGSYLVDGGYINNLPADVMSELGINTIIAVDVGGEVDTNYACYGDSLSGWWLLWNKWNPFTKRLNIPNLSDIQAQLAYVSSEAVLERVKKQNRCLYLRPPITEYGTLDFAKFEEIVEVGYNYAQKEITEWKKQRADYSLPSVESLTKDEKSVPILRRRSSAGAKLQKFYEFNTTSY